MTANRLWSPLVALLFGLAPAAFTQWLPVSSDFQVNRYTILYQNNTVIAVAADGDFVIVWQSDQGAAGQDGMGSGVFGQRFGSTGARQGGEFLVNSRTVQNQFNPSVAMDADGDFVVVWQSIGVDAGLDSGIAGQRFDRTGARKGAEFLVNSYTIDDQYVPDVAMEDNGDFVVVWTSSEQDPGTGAFAQRFDSAGQRLGVELQVNTYAHERQFFPGVAADADGDFVVVWNSEAPGPFDGLFGQRFDSLGVRRGVEFQVQSSTSSTNHYQSVVMDDDGDFAVVWQAEFQDPSGAIFGQLFASSGAKRGPEFRVNVFTAGDQQLPDVAMNAVGDFVTVWQSPVQDPGAGIFGRAFASSGSPVGLEFQVNTYTPGVQQVAEIAMTDGGDFVVTWTSQNHDGSGDGVFARRFRKGSSELPVADIDGDGEVLPLTDGLLLLRALFGFVGDALVIGAIDDSNCSRCDSGAIEAYFPTIVLLLDVDGDAANEPLTDGLLILRYLFGFRDAPLINGAYDSGSCTRCTADQMEDFIATLIV